MSMPSKASPISFLSIAPYWAGLVLVPMVAYAAIWGGMVVLVARSHSLGAFYRS